MSVVAAVAVVFAASAAAAAAVVHSKFELITTFPFGAVPARCITPVPLCCTGFNFPQKRTNM